MRPATRLSSLLGVGVVLLAGTACHAHEQSLGSVRSSADQGPQSGTVFQTANPPNVAGVDPGIHPSVVYGKLTNPDSGNAAAAAQGRQLFVQYNCSGCHGGRAGGGMGPSLRDKYWVYGNSDAQLYGTVVEGRSAGMPAWGAKIPRDQIWQLITYIRTLGTSQEPDPPPPQAHPLAHDTLSGKG